MPKFLTQTIILVVVPSTNKGNRMEAEAGVRDGGDLCVDLLGSV